MNYTRDKGKQGTIKFQQENCKSVSVKSGGTTLTVKVPPGVDKSCFFFITNKNNCLCTPQYHVLITIPSKKDIGKKFKPQAQEKERRINRPTNKPSGARYQVKAVVNYTAKNARELSFKVGDIINVSQKSNTGWWQAEFNGRRGVIPSDYVQQI